MSNRYDPDAERLTLGAALTGHPVDPLAAIVDPEDFNQPRNAAVWRAILRAHEAGNPVEPSSVRLALDASDRVDPVYLAELYGEASLTADGTWHAQRVADEAALRRIGVAAIKVGQIAEQSSDVGAARDAARAAIEDATSTTAAATPTGMSDLLTEVLDIAQHGTSPALSTPWPDIDQVIGGIAPGRLVVVGARPGGGKSLFLANLATHMAETHGHATLFASMEMPRVEVGQRMVAARAKVDLGDLMAGRLTEAQWGHVSQAHAALEAMPLTVDDTPGQTLSSLRNSAREIGRERDDLALICVDYLQLMGTPDLGKSASRAEKLGAVTRGLKILARETGACVLAAAQVNRESTHRRDGRPTMADLRESGSIEADADQVLLLHRPDDHLPEIECLIDKNRHGPKGVRHLHLMGHYARLESVSSPFVPAWAKEA